MRKSLLILGLFIGLFIFCAALPAQGAPGDPADWGNLQQLQPGQKVAVVQTNLAKHKGKFLAWTEEAITLRVKKRELTILREQVHRVRRLENHRVRNALIGAGAGAAAGVITIVPMQGSDAGSLLVRITFISLVFGGPGAAIGAVIPPIHPTIYRASYRAPRLTTGVNESPQISRKSVPPPADPRADEPGAPPRAGVPGAPRRNTTIENSNWARLGQLRAGQMMEVSLTNLAKHKGKFLDLTQEAISLRVKKREITIPRDAVHRVWAFGGRKIEKGAYIGLLAGFAYWPIFHVLIDDPVSIDRNGIEGFHQGYGIHDLIKPNLISAAIGAGVGAVASLGWRERILFYERGNEAASPQASKAPARSDNRAPTTKGFRPASGDVTFQLSKTLRPFTTERAMEIMGATRPANLPGINEDEALAVRRRLYLAPGEKNEEEQ